MKTLKKKVLYDVVSLLAYTIVYMIIVFVFYIFVWRNLEFISNSITLSNTVCNKSCSNLQNFLL